jgi:oligopeptide transport system substrate-binding protein
MDESTGRLRWLRIPSVMAAIGLVVAACGTTQTSNNNPNNMASNDKQILRTNTNTEPNSFDPGQETYDYEITLGHNIFEPLLKPTKDLKDVTGAAASSYDVSSDGLTYTFHLRQNAKWSDGQPVKAQDFVYGWQRVLDPTLAAGYADPFFDGTVKGGEKYSKVDTKDKAAVQSYIQALGLAAPDDHTFKVTLQQPAGYFKWIATLWLSAPIRKDVVDKYGYDKWSSTPTNVIGNGPWKIQEEVPKDHITLVPNPNYWGDKPHIQKWTDYFIEDLNQAFSKYQTGELDVVNIPLANADLVKSGTPLSKEFKKVPQLDTFWIAMNLTKPPFDNVKVREAVSRAVDRNALVNDVAKGFYIARQTFIPLGMNGYKPSLGSAQDYDPAKAKAALQASGVPTSAIDKVKLLTRNTTTNKQLNEFIVNQINTNLGVHWTLDVIDSKTVTTNLRKGNFQIYGPDGWGADYPDQQDWFDIFTTGGCHGTNWGCWNNKDFDALVTKADQATKETERQSLYDQAQQMLEDQYIVAFLYHRPAPVLVKPYVQGVTNIAIDSAIYLPGETYSTTIYIANH